MGELDEVLSVRWDDGAGRGPAEVGAVGVAHGHLGEGWLIGHAINGGVLMALGVSAASSGLASVGHPDVLTWGAHFLSAASRRARRGARRGAPGWAHRVDGRDPRASRWATTAGRTSGCA